MLFKSEGNYSSDLNDASILKNYFNWKSVLRQGNISFAVIIIAVNQEYLYSG
jgi:hypothetical protein